MHGPDNVRDRMTLLLASDVPGRIERLRAEWGLDAGTLPNVDVFSSGDLPESTLNAGQGGTFVIVVNPRLLRAVRTGDFSPAGDPEYRMRYACRVLVWSIAQDWDKAIAVRDRLAGAVRMSLLQHPTLAVEGGDTGYLLHENTYTEDVGTPSRAAGSRCWAAAVLSVDMDVYEVIDAGSSVPPVGQAETVSPTAYAVGPPSELIQEGTEDDQAVQP